MMKLNNSLSGGARSLSARVAILQTPLRRGRLRESVRRPRRFYNCDFGRALFRVLFVLAYAFLILFGNALHFHSHMGCDSCPSNHVVSISSLTGDWPQIGADDFCKECRNHAHLFCPACHFFAHFRFFITTASAFLAVVLLVGKFCPDVQHILLWQRINSYKERAPPYCAAL